MSRSKPLSVRFVPVNARRSAATRPRRLAMLGCEVLEDRVVLSSVSLLKDLNTNGADSSLYYSTNSPSQPYYANYNDHLGDIGSTLAGQTTAVATLNGSLIFQQNDPVHGFELWESSGSSADTFLLKDLNPGTANSFPRYFTPYLGDLYFVADGPTGAGTELWKTDGTTAGTIEVATINLRAPGNGGAFRPVVAGGTLYFTVEDTNAQNTDVTATLWKSDGTTAGTQSVAVVNAIDGLSSANPTPTPLLALGNQVLMVGDDSTHGREIWISDGTSQGTHILKDVNPGSADAISQGNQTYQILSLGSKAVFSVNDGVHGAQLWVTDGTTAGTQPVTASSGTTAPAIFTSGIASGNYSYQTGAPVLNGVAYYVSPSFNSSGNQTGYSLWRTDGTTSGTFDLLDMTSGPGDVFVFNNQVYFDRDQSLWKTDGTVAGTSAVFTLTPEYQGGSQGIYYPTVAGSQIYFWSSDTLTGAELWSSDGSSGSIRRVKDIFPGITDSIKIPNTISTNDQAPMATAVGNQLFFWANDGTHGRQLWKSDGTSTGTALVADLTTGTADSSPHGFTQANGKVFFIASDPVYGTQLYATDGSSGGTTRVTTLPLYQPNSGNSAFDIHGPTPAGNLVYFSALVTNGSGGDYFAFEASDGTIAGTHQITPGDGSYSLSPDFSSAVAYNGKLYFDATSYSSSGQYNGDEELWVSDGTNAGTHMVISLPPNPIGYDGIQQFTVQGNLLFFVAGDFAQQLWKSDGTAAGTSMVAQFPTTTYGNSITQLTAGTSEVYFVANDGAHGRQLWSSDGTPNANVATLTSSGTYMVSDITYAYSQGPQNVTTLNDLVYFQDYDGTSSPPLWVSDGTTAGTVHVRMSTSNSSYPDPGSVMGVNAPNQYVNSKFFVNDGLVYFAAYAYHADPTTGLAPGFELWVTDGTDAGTTLLKDINTDPNTNFTSRPIWVSAVGDTVYFSAYDPTHGDELWQTDGTSANTTLVSDINPGSGSSNPTDLTSIGGILYFSADDGTHGAEPYVVTSDVSAKTYSYGPTAFQNNLLTPSSTDVIQVVTGVDDGASAVNLGTNTFNFYGTTYTGDNQLYVSTNGLVSLGGPLTSPENTPLSTSLPLPIIAPLWSDWTTATSPSQTVLAQFVDTTNSGTPNELIIQWTQVGRFGAASSATPATFQAVLQLNSGTAIGGVTFNYNNVQTNDSNANGATATVGLSSGSAGTPYQRLVVSYDSTSALVGNGQSIQFLSDMATSAGGGYAVNEGSTVTLNGANSVNTTGSGISLYEWDLNYDGTHFQADATGITATFSAVGLAGPATRRVALRTTDSNGLVSIDEAVVTIANVAPTVTVANPSATVAGGQAFTTTGSFTDPGPETWTAQVNYGDGGGFQALTLNSNKSFALSHRYNVHGTYTVTVKVTDSNGGVGLGTSSVLVNSDAPRPPQVATFQVNDGNIQRSMVKSLTITFSSLVTLSPGSISLTTSAGVAEGIITTVSTTSDNRTMVVITFTGSDIIGGSLSDHYYNLTLNAALISDSIGDQLDGTNSGTPGTNYSTTFFRLFGDYYGKGIVDASARVLFLKALNSSVGSAAYLYFFDYNSDGSINTTDQTQFNLRYGKKLVS